MGTARETEGLQWGVTGVRSRGRMGHSCALGGWLCSSGVRDGGVRDGSHGAIAVVPVGNGETLVRQNRGQRAHEGEASFPEVASDIRTGWRADSKVHIALGIQPGQV